jgi:pimeloyl-ACP methyl ester carboxylesterase
MAWDHTPITTHEVEVGAVRLAVAEAGRGGRPLLLAHGFTGTKEDFADWIDPLVEAGWWVVAPDHRGHGGSTRLADEAAYTLAAFAADLEALVGVLGWDRYALLGHSMGGMIAQELVLRDPARVERLVLMDTHHGAVEGLDPERVDAGMAILRAEGFDVYLTVLAQVAPRTPTPAEVALAARRPGLTAWNEAKLLAVDPAMYAAMAPQLVRRADRLADLATLALPTLVLVGAEDLAFVGAAHRMAAAMPGAELVVVPDAAHSPQFENPDAWWAAVSGFLHRI